VQEMHGVDFFVEPVRVLAAAVMQLADGRDPVAGIHEVMPPGAELAAVGMRLIPASDLGYVSTGGEAGSRRSADRAVGVGVGEPHPALGERIEVRRLHEGMAVAAERAARMLVGEEQQDVLGWHELLPVGQADPALVTSPRKTLTL